MTCTNMLVEVHDVHIHTQANGLEEGQSDERRVGETKWMDVCQQEKRQRDTLSTNREKETGDRERKVTDNKIAYRLEV